MKKLLLLCTLLSFSIHFVSAGYKQKGTTALVVLRNRVQFSKECARLNGDKKNKTKWEIVLHCLHFAFQFNHSVESTIKIQNYLDSIRNEHSEAASKFLREQKII